MAKTGDETMTTSNAVKTNKTTTDGLAVYDLDPAASELWVVAGPDGVDPTAIDPDDLPDGFRWVDGDEWSRLVFPIDDIAPGGYDSATKTGRCPANADTQQFLESCDAVTLIRESGDEFEFEYDDQVEVTYVPECLKIEWDV